MLELEDYQTIFSQHQDHEATQAKAEAVLLSYPRVCRRAKAYEDNKSGVGSPAIDGMPKSHSVINTVERRIVDGIYNVQKKHAIEQAIDACDELEAKLLRLRYIERQGDTDTYMDLKISQSSYNHSVKPEALEQFAEVYMLDDLIVYKSEINK